MRLALGRWHPAGYVEHVPTLESLARSGARVVRSSFERYRALYAQAHDLVVPWEALPRQSRPGSLSRFGLPAGGRLGLTHPTLDEKPPHWVLRAGFGIGD